MKFEELLILRFQKQFFLECHHYVALELHFSQILVTRYLSKHETTTDHQSREGARVICDIVEVITHRRQKS